MIQTEEKPWGGNWSNPEDKGTRSVNGKNQQWYHLWSENENVVRAVLTP